MKEKKGKVIFIAMTLIILALICFNGYLLYDKMNNNDNTNNSNGVDNASYLTIIEGHNVQIENKDAKVITQNDDYVLYYDKRLMLYDLENKNIERIDIEYDENLSFNIIGDNYITYYDMRCFNFEPRLENNSGVYNIRTKNVAFKNQYSAYRVAHNGDSSNIHISGYVVAYEYNKTKEEYMAKVINLEEMKIVISYDYKINSCGEVNATIYQYHDYKEQAGKQLIAVYTTNTCGDHGVRDNYVIYDNKGKVIDKIKDNEGVDFVSVEGDLKVYKYTRNSSSKIFDNER